MIHARKDYQHIQDATGKIPEDEPVFLLRAQDKAAAAAVRVWCTLHQMLGGESTIADIAWNHAKKMDKWPKKKSADL